MKSIQSIKDFLISIKNSINISNIITLLVISAGYFIAMINTIDMVKEDNKKTIESINKMLKENNSIETSYYQKR